MQTRVCYSVVKFIEGGIYAIAPLFVHLKRLRLETMYQTYNQGQNYMRHSLKSDVFVSGLNSLVPFTPPHLLINVAVL